MLKEEDAYLAAGNLIKGTEESKMFGKPCFKVKGKAFACFFEKSMVFKLSGKEHEEALKLKGSVLFDPSGKKRPMKDWVQVNYANHKHWEKFAHAAFTNVKSLTK